MKGYEGLGKPFITISYCYSIQYTHNMKSEELSCVFYINVSSTNILYNKVSCLSFAISTVCTRMDGFFGK